MRRLEGACENIEFVGGDIYIKCHPNFYKKVTIYVKAPKNKKRREVIK
jgi:hypothetical protein